MLSDRSKRTAGAVLLVAAFVGAVAFMVLRGSDSGPEIESLESERVTSEAGITQDEGPAPDFELATLEGNGFRLSDHEGKVVILNFWATWCAPCRVEIPDLIEMQEELKGEGVLFVGISLDHEGKEVVEQFAAEADFNYPILLDDGSVSDKYGGIYALPTTVLIDREGNISHRIPGMVTKDYLLPILKNLIEA